MAVVRLTQKLAEAAEPGAYWEKDSPKGLGLIVRESGRRSWVVQKSGRKRWTLGHPPEMTCAEARRRARDVILGQPEPVATMTLAEALEIHLRRMERRGRVSGEMIAGEIERHMGDWLRRPLHEITRQDCVARHNRITRRGAQTADRVMRHLRAVYNTALKRVDLPTNPTIAVEWHGAKRRNYPRLDLVTWWSQVDKIQNPIRRAWHITALTTGMRKTDCLTVRWADLDLNRRTLHRPCPKGGEAKAFTLPISEETATVIDGLPRINEWVFASFQAPGGHMTNPVEPDLPKPHHLRAEYMAIATDLGVPTYPKKLLVNHSVPRADITDGYVANPDIELCRPWQQKISEWIVRAASESVARSR